MSRLTPLGPPPTRLTAAQARRIALAAQGFADPRPTGRIDARQIRRVLARIGLLQLDSVNVFCRSHYLPIFSRLGPYPRAALDQLARHTSVPPPARSARADAAKRELFEYWAHEASLVPVVTEPYLRWRMARADQDAWGSIARMARDQPERIEQVRELVAQRGPLRSGDTATERAARRAGQMWNWNEGKIALEYLFWSGQVSAAYRVNFERYYDLAERVIPAPIRALPDPSVPAAQRELIRIAARAMGVATEPDLGDYFRLPRAESKARVAELVELGELLPVEVEDWNAPAYLWPAARRPRVVRARALLSPFDSLIWFRPRTERLFGFRYRIEIYTPAARRVHGYYVLPFLLGESLVARVDLKSDRQSGVLVVQGAHVEPGVDPDDVAAELAEELAITADWLGLGAVAVNDRGELAAALNKSVNKLSSNGSLTAMDV